MPNDIYSTGSICVAGRLIAEGPVDVDDIEDRLEEVSVRDCGLVDPRQAMFELSRMVDGSRLGQEDLWSLLAYGRNREIEGAIRGTLGLPATDPDGILLSFLAGAVDNGQVAVTVITPEPDGTTGSLKDPLVFVTGLHHRTAVYLPTLIEIAKRDHRKVISVDLPGMGGSVLPDNESVYAGDLVNFVKMAIWMAEIPEGGTFDLMAHSMGTVPARAIYEAGEVLGSKVGRVVMVAGLPAEEERTLNRRLAPSFARAATTAIVATGNLSPLMIGGRGMLDSRFINRHTAEERGWLHQRIDQEDLPSSLWAALSVFWGAHTRPILDQVGHDPRVRLVIPAHDNIFPSRHPEDLRGRRGILFVEGEGADHSFLAGPVANTQYVDVLLHALNDGLDPNQPTLNFGQMYRHIEGSFNPGISATTDGTLRLDASMDVTAGLFVLGRFGTGLALQAGPRFGIDLEDGKRRFDLMADGELTFKPLDFPVRLGVGADVVGSMPGGLSEHLVASVRINPEDIAAFGARALYTLGPRDRNGEFSAEFFLKVPFYL